MPDRNVAPPLRHTLEFKLPETVPFADGSASKAFLIPSNKQEVVKVEFIFAAGRVFENNPAAAHFTATMLEKGTVRNSAEAIASQLDFYSAYLEINPGFDNVSVALYCLSRNLKNVLALFLEMLSDPSFEPVELRRSREIFIQNLRVNLEKNSFLAGQLIRKMIFGDHPYGSVTTPQQAENITPEILKNHFSNHFAPKMVFVAGNIFDEDLKYLEEYLIRRKPGADYNTKNPSLPVVTRIDQEKPGSVQTSIRFGKPAIRRNHPDYPAFQLTNHLLGGFFGSRLMKNIREEKGLTYGIYSSVQQFSLAAMHVIGADVNKENTNLAIDAVQSELINLAEIKEEELQTAKRHFNGSLQNDINTIFAAASKIQMLKINDLPYDYYQNLILSVDKVTTDEIRKMAETYFRPDDFSIAVV